MARLCDYCGDLRDKSHDYARCLKFITAIARSQKRIPPYCERTAVEHKDIKYIVVQEEE